MRLNNLVVLGLPLLTLFVVHESEAEKKLQIGVKKRADPEKCKIKSKKGDVLHMHYSVSHLFL